MKILNYGDGFDPNAILLETEEDFKIREVILEAIKMQFQGLSEGVSEEVKNAIEDVFEISGNGLFREKNEKNEYPLTY